MPVNIKRICGPDGAVPLQKLIAQQCEASEVRRPCATGAKRQDGRKPDELRPIFLKTGIVSQAKGSAYMEIGSTKVICTVYGPREIAKRQDISTRGQISCEFKYAPFSCPRRRQYQPDNEERELSKVLVETMESAVCLHKFPKAQLDVYVNVLDNGGSAFAAAITTAGAAVANAGVPMYDVIIGCSLHCYNDVMLLDPTASEEADKLIMANETGKGNVTLALMPSLQQVSCLLQDGVLEKHHVVQAVKLLTDSCHNLHPAIQRTFIDCWRQESEVKDFDSKSKTDVEL